MKGLDARLDRIEGELNARQRRECLKDAPLLLTLYKGETVADYPGRGESAKVPLVLVMGKTRPIDNPISERDRPFINAGSSVDSEAS